MNWGSSTDYTLKENIDTNKYQFLYQSYWSILKNNKKQKFSEKINIEMFDIYVSKISHISLTRAHSYFF